MSQLVRFLAKRRDQLKFGVVMGDAEVICGIDALLLPSPTKASPTRDAPPNVTSIGESAFSATEGGAVDLDAVFRFGVHSGPSAGDGGGGGGGFRYIPRFEGMTALHMACLLHSPAVILHLLRRGAALSAASANSRGGVSGPQDVAIHPQTNTHTNTSHLFATAPSHNSVEKIGAETPTNCALSVPQWRAIVTYDKMGCLPIHYALFRDDLRAEHVSGTCMRREEEEAAPSSLQYANASGGVSAAAEGDDGDSNGAKKKASSSVSSAICEIISAFLAAGLPPRLVAERCYSYQKGPQLPPQLAWRAADEAREWYTPSAALLLARTCGGDAAGGGGGGEPRLAMGPPLHSGDLSSAASFGNSSLPFPFTAGDIRRLLAHGHPRGAWLRPFTIIDHMRALRTDDALCGLATLNAPRRDDYTQHTYSPAAVSAAVTAMAESLFALKEREKVRREGGANKAIAETDVCEVGLASDHKASGAGGGKRNRYHLLRAVSDDDAAAILRAASQFHPPSVARTVLALGAYRQTQCCAADCGSAKVKAAATSEPFPFLYPTPFEMLTRGAKARHMQRRAPPLAFFLEAHRLSPEAEVLATVGAFAEAAVAAAQHFDTSQTEIGERRAAALAALVLGGVPSALEYACANLTAPVILRLLSLLAPPETTPCSPVEGICSDGHTMLAYGACCFSAACSPSEAAALAAAIRIFLSDGRTVRSLARLHRDYVHALKRSSVPREVEVAASAIAGRIQRAEGDLSAILDAFALCNGSELYRPRPASSSSLAADPLIPIVISYARDYACDGWAASRRRQSVTVFLVRELLLRGQCLQRPAVVSGLAGDGAGKGRALSATNEVMGSAIRGGAYDTLAGALLQRAVLCKEAEAVQTARALSRRRAAATGALGAPLPAPPLAPLRACIGSALCCDVIDLIVDEFAAADGVMLSKALSELPFGGGPRGAAMRGHLSAIVGLI